MRHWKKLVLLGSISCLLPVMATATTTQTPAQDQSSVTNAATKAPADTTKGSADTGKVLADTNKGSGDTAKVSNDKKADKAPTKADAKKRTDPIIPGVLEQRDMLMNDAGLQAAKAAIKDAKERMKALETNGQPFKTESSEADVVSYAKRYAKMGELLDYYQWLQQDKGLSPWDLRSYEVGVGDLRLSEAKPVGWREKDVSTKGKYTTYDIPGGSYVTFREPEAVGGMKQQTLFEPGASFRDDSYVLPVTPGVTPLVSYIHVDNKYLILYRHVHVGSTRGEVLVAYGAPNAMWRDDTNDTMYFVYVSSADLHGKNLTIKKENPLDISKGYNTHQMMTNANTQYLVFGIKSGKVDSIDMFNSYTWPASRFASLRFYEYRPNRLGDEDFTMMGYTLGKPFYGSVDQQWESRGKAYGMNLVSYPGVYVLTNDNHTIGAVMLTSSYQGVTRRGLTLGDRKGLMLFLYGVPTSSEPGDTPDTTVYTYMNRNYPGAQLHISVDNKKETIKDIMLADQPMKQLMLAKNNN